MRLQQRNRNIVHGDARRSSTINSAVVSMAMHDQVGAMTIHNFSQTRRAKKWKDLRRFPVIAYDRGSVPEIMVDGVTGFVVDDSAGAIDAVKRLREIDRKLCRRHFERHFSVERMAQEYVIIYKRLVRGEALPLTLEDGVPSWTDLVSPNTTT